MSFTIIIWLLVFLLVPVAVVVLIVRGSRPSTRVPAQADPVPPPPTPAGPTAQLIATFGPSTGWHGKKILYDGGAGIIIEGVGPVSPNGVLSYEEEGQIEWASEPMRDWIADWAKQA